jgi:[ribosomal protein S5]-alanine N-acetyltransferase
VSTPFARLDDLPVLETERLRLRPLKPADAEELHAVFSDPEVMRYWSEPPHRDVARTEEMIGSIRAAFESREVFQWGIERTADGRLLGTVTLIAAGSQPRAELGYILGREHWGQGFAGEAQRRAVEFAFDDLGLHRLEADTEPANAASVRSLERLGFRQEGLLRERWTVAGRASDSAIFGLLASEWRA